MVVVGVRGVGTRRCHWVVSKCRRGIEVRGTGWCARRGVAAWVIIQWMKLEEVALILWDFESIGSGFASFSS